MNRCNPNFQDFQGKNCLLIAAEKGHLEIVQILLRIGKLKKYKKIIDGRNL